MAAGQRTSYVLVVDDNPVNVALYERVISHIGMCYPKCFTKASDALAWAQQNNPAVAIVDYRMPEMDGLEFIRRFRSIPGRNAVPCVMLTGVKEGAVRHQALQMGVADFLNKPVNADRLMALISKLTDQR